MKRLVAAGLFLLVSLLYAGPDLAVRTHLEPDSCTIGDWLHVTIRVDHSPSWQPRWPRWDQVDLGPFRVLRDSVLSADEHQLLVGVYDVGALHFPALEFSALNLRDSTMMSVYSDSLPVRVLSVRDSLQPPAAADSAAAGLFPIQDPLSRALSWRDLVYYLTWFAGLLSLVLLIIWWRRRRTVKGAALSDQEPPDLRSPLEKALAFLREIEKARLPQRGEVVEYYFLISLALRRYLEGMTGLPAAEMTTGEVKRAFSDSLRADLLHELVEILENADLVKFAGFLPADAVHRSVLERARRLLEQMENHFLDSSTQADSVEESAS